MSKDMPMARNILQRSKQQAKKKEQKESFARNFFWWLGVLVAGVLNLIAGTPGVVESSLWSVIVNIAGMIVLSFGLGLLFALMFSGFYWKLAAVEDGILNSLELDALSMELRNHPACLESLLKDQDRHGKVRIATAAQALVEAGISEA